LTFGAARRGPGSPGACLACDRVDLVRPGAACRRSVRPCAGADPPPDLGSLWPRPED